MLGGGGGGCTPAPAAAAAAAAAARAAALVGAEEDARPVHCYQRYTDQSTNAGGVSNSFIIVHPKIDGWRPNEA